MASNPHAPRRDYSVLGPAVLGALVLALLALLAFAVLRPGPSQGESEATAKMMSEMDAAQARNESTRAAAERERQKLL